MYRIGIVALHESGALMEWGVWHYRGSASRNAWIARKFCESIDLHAPALILIRQRKWRQRRSSFVSATMRTVHRMAQGRSIPVQIVGAWEITSYFRNRGCRNKRMIGEFLTRHFTELSAKLPRHRKSGEPERHNAVIFDALATAVAMSCRDYSGPRNGLKGQTIPDSMPETRPVPGPT
jgi:hypothetical protein